MTSRLPEAARGSHYRAFALPLSSTFDLPGLRPAPTAPGALSLTLSTRIAVERLWSGGDHQPVWTTAIDGRPYTMRLGAKGDYLMSYGDDALFLLSSRPPNVLDLLPFAVGFPHLRGRKRRRFVLFSRLAAEIPVCELLAPECAGPGAIADLVEPLVFGAAPRKWAA